MSTFFELFAKQLETYLLLSHNSVRTNYLGCSDRVFKLSVFTNLSLQSAVRRQHLDASVRSSPSPCPPFLSWGNPTKRSVHSGSSSPLSREPGAFWKQAPLAGHKGPIGGAWFQKLNGLLNSRHKGSLSFLVSVRNVKKRILLSQPESTLCRVAEYMKTP